MLCFKYRCLLTHSMTIRIRPTGCYDMIKPRFWLRYHEAPVTDTSIASSCWANTRRGCHRAVPHSFLKGRRDPISFPLSPKRLLSFPWVRTLLCLSVQFYSERIEIFELERTYPFSDIIRESSNIPRELSSGKFLLINFARSKYFGGEFCLTARNNFFFRLCSGNSDGYVSWRFVFLRSQQSRIRFCLHLYQQTTLLIIEKGSFTWVRIKLIWLLIFWPPWLPQLAFHHRCLRPHRTRWRQRDW